MYRLIYSSRASSNFDPDSLELMVKHAQKRNLRNNITGLLTYARGHFLQVLEGEPLAVSRTFVRIAHDPRHYDVQILTCGPVAGRLFKDWHMGFVPFRANGPAATLITSGGANVFPSDPDMALTAMLLLNDAQIRKTRQLARV